MRRSFVLFGPSRRTRDLFRQHRGVMNSRQRRQAAASLLQKRPDMPFEISATRKGSEKGGGIQKTDDTNSSTT